MRVFAIGATGFIGRHVVSLLVDQGHDVAVLHRGETVASLPQGVRDIRGNRDRLGDFRTELERFAPDVVVDVIPYTEQQAREVATTVRGSGARVVAVSSADVYRNHDGFRGKATAPPDAVPLSEDAPLRETRYPYRGQDLSLAYVHDYEKILVEQTLLGDSERPATVVRLPAVYGPGDKQHRLRPYLQRMAIGGEVPVLLEEGQTRWHWTRGFVENVAAALAAGLVGENVMESDEQMHQRRAIAYQAWWEHQPVRVPRAKSWADLTITRTIDWGALARFWVLDTRQYRSDQACGDGQHDVPCGDWADPARTILGAAQERWLLDGLGGSRGGWQVLANQVTVAPIDGTAGPPQGWSMDTWAGYPASLGRLLDAIRRRAPNRTVVITGDTHSNWVSELRARYDRPDAPVIGAEFVGTSISSGGDGADVSGLWTDEARADNPHIRWHNARRGYVRCAVTGDDWRTTYRTLPFVSQPGAEIATASEWRLARGRPGIEQV